MKNPRVLALLLGSAALFIAVAPSAEAATVTIEMHDNKAFVPAEASVRVGDTIVWVNKGVVPHTATLSGVFDSGLVPAGASYELVAKETFPPQSEYVCTLHVSLGMKGRLTVGGATGSAEPEKLAEPEVSPSPSPLPENFAARWWARTSKLPVGLRLLGPLALALFLLLCAFGVIGYIKARRKGGEQ